MRHSTIAKIVHVQLEDDNRFYAEAEIDNTGPEAHAPPLSDVEAGTHRLSISGEGKPPFEVVQSIMARAFERGELPA
jgi:hypothetical protein